MKRISRLILKLQQGLDGFSGWARGDCYIPGTWFEPVPVRRVRRNRYRG
jgi:hypothetical protein